MRKLLEEDGENRAVRSFLMGYELDIQTVGAFKEHMMESGFNKLWPDWVDTTNDKQHLNKFMAQDWLRYLFNLENANGKRFVVKHLFNLENPNESL